MLAAFDKGVRALVASGAKRVASIHNGHPAHDIAPALRRKAAPGDNPPLDAWIRSVQRRGLPPNGVGLFSAHQMGSCRMGTSPASSVVDEDGELWDVDGLFVMDASVFPTASGANPMVTTLAIAQLLATRLATRLTNGFYEGVTKQPEHAAAYSTRQKRRCAAKAYLSRRASIKTLVLSVLGVIVANLAMYKPVMEALNVR